MHTENTTTPTPLLGGLTPQAFMRRHWQKKPLLVRQALPSVAPPLARPALFDLVAREGVESRLIARQADRWTLRHGPFARRALPPVSRAGWTLLVQGLDQHVDAAHELLARFRFVPEARLDDLMLSYASDGGGVGPHVDSYDVFLLQVQGRRRWRIGRIARPELEPGLPLKILRNFAPEDEFLLEPGDLLYLPPGWAHDGVAEGECMTCSIGFRASGRDALAREVMQRLLDATEPPPADPLYRDPRQAATDAPGLIPEPLQAFAAEGMQRLLTDPRAVACALGEILSDLPAHVTFDAGAPLPAASGVRLDRRSRMLYDRWHVFLNGEAYQAGGRDARLIRTLADRRVLAAREISALSEDARELLQAWAEAGWLHPDGE